MLETAPFKGVEGRVRRGEEWVQAWGGTPSALEQQ